MSKDNIRIRFLSLNDGAEVPIQNVLLYLKKLTRVVPSDASQIQLKEKSPNSSTVLSWNEPCDLQLDDEFFQLLFIESNDEQRIFTDIVFYQHYLREILTGSIENHDNPGGIFYASLDKKCVLKYSLQFVSNAVKVMKIHRKVPERHSIRDHFMVKHQFTEPVWCAICTKFIAGFRLQGYRCERCSLVTHKKCHKRIPFWCQKSPNPMPLHYSGNAPIEYHPPHLFKRYKPSILPSKTSCRNCGSQVSVYGRECSLCEFIVHERCEMSVPPMCGISYKTRANALERDLIRIGNTGSDPCVLKDLSSQYSDTSSLESTGTSITDEGPTSYCSTTSSIDVKLLNPPLPQVDLTNLPKLSDFQCIGRLGSGQYSNVYRARHLPSEKNVAIKMIDGSNKSARDQFEVERQLLFRYSGENPFIIKSYCSFHQGSYLFLVMEFVGDDTIKEKIQRTRMNDTDIRYYLVEIISVIEYLHSQKIIHRDLKLEHILICPEGHIRLVDFGLSRVLNNDDEVCHTICGTDTYMSPEIRRLERDQLADGYSYPVDFWAIGIMLIQLLCGDAMDFYDEATDLSNLAEDLLSGRLISAEALSLVRGLLEVDPKKRLGSATSPHGSIREHAFFRVGEGIDWDSVDEGILKSIHRRPDRTRTYSDPSLDSSLPISSLDRGTHFDRVWTMAEQSKCTAQEEELYKQYDYINRSLWQKLTANNE